MYQVTTRVHSPACGRGELFTDECVEQRRLPRFHAADDRDAEWLTQAIADPAQPITRHGRPVGGGAVEADRGLEEHRDLIEQARGCGRPAGTRRGDVEEAEASSSAKVARVLPGSHGRPAPRWRARRASC